MVPRTAFSHIASGLHSSGPCRSTRRQYSSANRSARGADGFIALSKSATPAFRHLRIEPLPYSTAHIRTAAHEGDGAMEITIHQHLIEQCVTMACSSKADRDKALWLSMAQSWVRLADEVARAEMAHTADGIRRH
jgi:hypothetical protein